MNFRIINLVNSLRLKICIANKKKPLNDIITVSF